MIEFFTPSNQVFHWTGVMVWAVLFGSICGSIGFSVMMCLRIIWFFLSKITYCDVYWWFMILTGKSIQSKNLVFLYYMVCKSSFNGKVRIGPFHRHHISKYWILRFRLINIRRSIPKFD